MKEDALTKFGKKVKNINIASLIMLSIGMSIPNTEITFKIKTIERKKIMIEGKIKMIVEIRKDLLKEKIKNKRKLKTKGEKETVPGPEIANIKKSLVKEITIGKEIEIQKNNLVIKNIEEDLIHLNHQKIKYQDQNLHRAKKGPKNKRNQRNLLKRSR